MLCVSTSNEGQESGECVSPFVHSATSGTRKGNGITLQNSLIVHSSSTNGNTQRIVTWSLILRYSWKYFQCASCL